MVAWRDGMVEEHAIDRARIQPKVMGSPDGIVGILDGNSMCWIVFAIQETGDAKDTVAIGASRIAAEGNGEQFKRLFLTHRVESFDPPEDLILAGRCRDNRGRR